MTASPGRGLAVTLALASAVMLPGCGAIRDNSFPDCSAARPTVLMAQAVPAAQLIPCVRALPVGWHVHGLDIRSGMAQFWLDSDIVGKRALNVVLTPRCIIARAHESSSDEPGARRLELVERRRPAFVAQWLYIFPGGCVTYRFTFATMDRRGATAQIQRGLSFVSRRAVAAGYRRQTGDSLDPPRAAS